ncbi:Pre-mRNA-splicing factor 38 [Baffinella frigidus]|nr:Pre-mRNA-splicing factor 38 [Cryptophyta sp. CCMP2293]
MANKTDASALSIHGTNPQFIIEKILRAKIHGDLYWKEHCFALTAETLLDHIGGTFGGNIKPVPFIQLVLKLLQIQPDKDIIVEFIKNEEFKYVRALGAFYMRLVGKTVDVYQYLEPLLNDYRKLRIRMAWAGYDVTYMDEFIDKLLREDMVLDIALPTLQKRMHLEEARTLQPRISALEDDLDEVSLNPEP